MQGDSDKILRLAVGHMPQTALPGQSGNMVFAGHRDSFFRALRSVRKGDQIVVDTPSGSYDYEVESTSIVAPTDLSVLRSINGRRELTLITCYPFSWIGSAPQRFIVQAGIGQQLKSGEAAPPLESGQADPTTRATVEEESEASGPSAQPDNKECFHEITPEQPGDSFARRRPHGAGARSTVFARSRRAGGSCHGSGPFVGGSREREHRS